MISEPSSILSGGTLGDAEDELCEHAERAIAERPADAEIDPRRLLVEDTAAFVREFHRWVDAQSQDGLTLPGLRLVERLHCRGPAMMRALADELGLSPRNMTALVDVLEGDGLVARRPHPSDRRAIMVELTTTGCEAADVVLSPRIAAMGELFDVLSDDERQRFAGMVARLRAAMRDSPGC
jgi:DNA-binding MarR family transcriptional regulator